MDEFYKHLKRISRRMRWRDGWSLAQITLWIPCLGMLLIQLIGRIFPIGYLGDLSILICLLWLFSTSIFAIVRPMSLIHVARKADIELGLNERLSTSYSLRDMRDRFPSILVAAQERDALEAIRKIDIPRAFRIKWLHRKLIISMGLLLSFIAIAMLPNPMDEVLEQHAKISLAAQQQAKNINELSLDIQVAEELSPEEREELIHHLQELAESLRSNSGDLEKALREISNIEQKLLERLDPQLNSRKTNLVALASHLQKKLDQKISSSESSNAIVDLLSSLGKQVQTMDDTQRLDMARFIAQLAAEATQSGNEELGKALASTGQEILSGDQQSLEQSIQNAQLVANENQQSLVDQNAFERALAQLTASQLALAQAGKTLAKSQQSVSSSNSLPNQGLLPGQSPGNNQPPITGGGGTSADTLPPGTGRGSTGKPQGDKPSNSESDYYGKVFVPWITGQTGNNDLFIPGLDSDMGQVQSSEGGSYQPGFDNTALIPYYQVYYQYLATANLAMEHGYIPMNLIEYIRFYFTNLEP